MSISRYFKYFPLLLFGILMAWLLSRLVGRFFPGARTGTMIVLVLFWLTGFVQAVVRDIRGEPERGVFADPSVWSPQEHPPEFRFITRGMTVEEVVAGAGTYTRLTETGLLRYDLPDGRVLFVHTDADGDETRRVTGIQLWRAEYETPVST
jgi:hypothetical protein